MRPSTPSLSRRRLLQATALGLGAGLAGGLGRAQAQPSADPAAWPDRPIRYVVPWPAGGPTDTFGRTIARELSARLGQPVVVENRTGASGTVGVHHVARAQPDGYTLLAPNTTALIGSVVAMPEEVRFDPLKDFLPIGLFVETATILWVHPGLKIDSFQALLERARDSRQEPLAFGTTGSGSVSEQSVEQIASHFRLQLTKVPYKGNAPQVTDLVAGHIQFGVADYPTAAPHAEAGRLKPLLVIGRNRLPEFPELPTTAELGLAEPDFTIWNGLFAPAGTPEPIVTRLRQALEASVRSEAFRRIAEGHGNRTLFQTGEEASARLLRDLQERQNFTRSLQQASLN